MKKAAILLAIFLAMVMGAGVMGCGGGSKKGDPEQVVTDFWNAVQKGDLAAAGTYLSVDLGMSTIDEVNSVGGAQLELFEVVLKYVTMEIAGSEQKGDTATVSLVLTLPDMEAVGEEVWRIVNERSGGISSISQGEYDALIQELMAVIPDLLASAPQVQRPQTVSLVWEDDDWKISSDLFGEIQAPM